MLNLAPVQWPQTIAQAKLSIAKAIAQQAPVQWPQEITQAKLSQAKML